MSSIQEKVEFRVKRLKKGFPFSISSFYELGSRAAVQQALSRLTKSGEIVRMERGVYCRPKPLKSLPSVKTTASAEQLARLWARQNKFKLVPQGMEEAYRLGLQTQAPMIKMFWTNGPTKEFRVGSQKVIAKNINERLLKWEKQPAGRILRALSVFSESSLSIASIREMLSRLQVSKTEAIVLLNKLKTHREISRLIPKIQQLVM